MPVDKKTLTETLQTAFPQADIETRSLTGDDDHWEVSVNESTFAGKTRITQHRMVQDSLKHLNIHAVSIKTSAK